MLVYQEEEGAMTEQFLPLAEFASKYRISISTLRRKIKNDEIRYSFADGRYLVLDAPMGTHQGVHRPSQDAWNESLMSASGEAKVHTEPPPKQVALANPASTETSNYFTDEPNPATGTTAEHTLQVASQLLNELKRAYSQILQEKEEQIVQLREEVADLKTLVKVLES